jgi:hypothetical protein
MLMSKMSDLGWQTVLIMLFFGVLLVCGALIWWEETRERRRHILPKPQPDSRFNSMRDFK